MKLEYYSVYPYKAEDFKRGHDECGSYYDMPFRLYHAATCEGIGNSISQFILDCWEVMDMPSCKGIDNIHQPYMLDGINVIPTKHFYGATNSCDGVYVINNKYYIIDYSCDVKEYSSFEEAFNIIAEGRFGSRFNDYKFNVK